MQKMTDAENDRCHINYIHARTNGMPANGAIKTTSTGVGVDFRARAADCARLLPAHRGVERWCFERAQGRMRPGSVLVHAPPSAFQTLRARQTTLLQPA